MDKGIPIWLITADMWKNDGRTLEARGIFGQALDAYSRACELEPENADNWKHKGSLLLKRNNPQAALQAYSKACELNPTNDYLWNCKGNALLKLTNLEAALQAHSRACELNPYYNYFWKCKGDVYYYKAEYQQAILYYDKALEIGSKDVYTLINKALAYLMLDELKKAKFLIDKVLETKADFPFAVLAQSLVFYHEGEEAAASEFLKQLDKYYYVHSWETPNTIEMLEIYFYAVNHFIHLKRHDLAQEYIDKAQLLKSDYLPILRLVTKLKHLLDDCADKRESVMKEKVECIETVFSDIQIKSKINSETKTETETETAHAQGAVTFKQDEPQSTSAAVTNNTIVFSQPSNVSFHSAESHQTLLPSPNESMVMQSQVQQVEKSQVLVPVVSQPENFFNTLHRISWNNIKLGKCQGNGSYGKVYQAQWQGTQVAIKKLHLEELTEELKKSFEQEITIMHTYRYPHIVQLYGICQEVEHYALVMEYMEKGSLRRLLSDEMQNLTWLKRIKIALDIGRGLHYLHSQNIWHRDLKSANILIDSQYQAKISDFGLAKIKLETSSMSSKPNVSSVGSVRWKAPELFKRKAMYTSACDIYSYGMVLWELTSGTIPFADANDDATVISFIKDGEQEEIPKDCPAELDQLIKACWSVNPQERPTAANIVTALEAIYVQLLPESEFEAEKTKQLEKTQITQLKTQEKIRLMQKQENLLVKEDTLEQQMNSEKENYNELLKQKKQLEQTIEQLKLKLRQTEQEHTYGDNKNQQSSIDELNQELEKEYANSQQLEQGIIQLYEKIEEQISTIEELNDALKNRTREFNQLVDEIKSQEATIDYLNKQLKKQQAELSKVSNESEEKRHKTVGQSMTQTNLIVTHSPVYANINVQQESNSEITKKIDATKKDSANTNNNNIIHGR